MNLEFFRGIPEVDGWYLVKLAPGHTSQFNQQYDVDYCRHKSSSDGGGREWVKWYSHNIECWTSLENLHNPELNRAGFPVRDANYWRRQYLKLEEELKNANLC